jgi:c-di-GMP-binding flagellar brake protein YcgR
MGERRLYQRIYPQHHAVNYDCFIELGGRYYKTRLLDVSQGGARLLLEDEPDIDPNGKTGKVKYDHYDEQFMAGVLYSVAWARNAEVGVSFSEPLNWEFGFLCLYYENA